MRHHIEFEVCGDQPKANYINIYVCEEHHQPIIYFKWNTYAL